VTKDRAEALGELVQPLVNPLRPPTVGNLLRLSPIADLHKKRYPATGTECSVSPS